MKIRPDFVTNSSSSSYGEVIIDNPVLLEILAKYKALGVFSEDEGWAKFSIGSYLEEDAFGDPFVPVPELSSLIPAFHFCFSVDSSIGDWIPHSINEMLQWLLAIIPDFNSSSEPFKKFKAEVQQREDEITDAYRLIKIYSRDETYDGRYEYFLFEYNQEKGEVYKTEGTGNMDF